MNGQTVPRVGLGELLTPVARPISVVDSQQYTTLGVKWYAHGVFTRPVQGGHEIAAKKLFRVEPGDFIYNRLFAWKGSFALVGPEHAGCVVSGEFPLFRLDEARIVPRYLLWYFTQPSVWEGVQKRSAGTAHTSRLRLKEGDLLRMSIPLPPVNEQRCMVSMLDEAHGLCRLSEATEQRTDDLIPAVFHQMFGDPSIQPLHPLEQVAEIVSGVAKGRKFKETQQPVTVPYLRVANVQDGFLDLREIKTIEALPPEVDELSLQPGDVVLTEGGDIDKLGRGAIWHGEIERCIHQNHIFRVRVHPDKLDPVFFANLLLTAHAKGYFLRCAKRTTNLASINMRQLKALPVPLPPLDLQRRFAVRVAEVRSMKADQALVRRRLEDLFGAMLHRAFRGELVARESIRVAAASGTPDVRRHAPADRLTRRAAVASSLSRRFRSGESHRKYVGVTLIEKALFLLEAHAGLTLGGVYRRMPRGPHDPSARQWVEDNAPASGWLVVQQRNSHDRELVEYKPGPSIAEADEIATAVIAEQGSAASAVEGLIRRIASWNTEEAEMYATLYAAWNDLLFDAQQQSANPTATAPTPATIPTDRIIAEFHDWHREKREKFSAPRLKAALASMRTWGLVPSGDRRVTVTEPSLFAGSATEQR